MDLILLLIALAIIGCIVYLLTTQIEMLKPWASTLQAFALICLLVYLLTRFFPLPNLLPR